MNAVFGSILENLQCIEIVEKPTLPVFAKDKLSTSDGRELTLKEFLEKYLASEYIVKNGPIFSMNGASNNIDCVILSPSHPKLYTPVRDVIIAEGVYAAVEVKPDITVLTESSEFVRGLAQSKSVKNLSRETFFVIPKPDYYKKIPFIVFSMKGTSPISTINYLRERINKGLIAIDEVPDMIVILNKGAIFYNPHLSSTVFSVMAQRNYPVETYGDAGFVFIDTTQKEYTLAMFLLLLFKLTPAQPILNSSILSKYLLNGLLEGTVPIRVFPIHNPFSHDAYASK